MNCFFHKISCVVVLSNICILDDTKNLTKKLDFFGRVIRRQHSPPNKRTASHLQDEVRSFANHFLRNSKNEPTILQNFQKKFQIEFIRWNLTMLQNSGLNHVVIVVQIKCKIFRFVIDAHFFFLVRFF
jgi:hypothetical protein